jgi:hypothetical protein
MEQRHKKKLDVELNCQIIISLYCSNNNTDNPGQNSRTHKKLAQLQHSFMIMEIHEINFYLRSKKVVCVKHHSAGINAEVKVMFHAVLISVLSGWSD